MVDKLDDPDDQRPVPGYEGIYNVTRDGRILSLSRFAGRTKKVFVPAREIRPILQRGHGYWVVNLSKDGEPKQHRLHIIVAKVFVPNPEGKLTVNHEDGIKSHNWAGNLTWMTHAEQMAHAAKMRLTALGDKNGSTKIKEAQLVGLRDRVLAGELICDLADEIGVKRATVTLALTRAFGDTWDVSKTDKRRRAANVRWARERGEVS